MKISVIIPTYKPKSYLFECLDSLCGQTFPLDEFEVIIVLNGCNDPYNTEIQTYIREHPYINWKFFQTDASGVSNARNIALSKMDGDYVAFLDDDDFISSTYLSSLYAKADKETAVISDVYAFRDGCFEKQLPYVMTDAFLRYSPRERMRAKKVRKFFSGPCMKLISSAAISDRRFNVRFRNGEDSLFMFLISDRVKYVAFTSPDAKYYRRYRCDSAITAKKRPSYVISNSFKLIGEYSRIYFRNFGRYNLCQYIRAVLGAFHYMIVNLF